MDSEQPQTVRWPTAMVAVLLAAMVIAKSRPVAVGRACAGLRLAVVRASAARPSASVRRVVWVTVVPVAVRPRVACRPAVQLRRPVCPAAQSPGVVAAPVVRVAPVAVRVAP
uniref:hypothetical protein n=1 Tax=Mycobacterium persicum TaxID=1487726 RepID=UPI00280B0029